MMSDQEQACSDDGSWESKSDRSLPSTSSNNEEAPSTDHLEPDLENYILEHKNDLNIDTIKSFYKLQLTLKKTEPKQSLKQYIDHLRSSKKLAEQELDLSKKEAQKFKCKSRQLQDQLIKELSTFDTFRVDNMLKSSSCKHYVNALRSTIKTKDEIIESQNKTIKQLERDDVYLEERLKRANELIGEQRKALQTARAQAKSNDFEFDRRRNLSHQGSVVFDMSPDPRFDTGQGHNIPPPPMVDPDDIIRLVNSPLEPHITSTNSSSYNLSFINNSIPPPPHVEMNLDEILRDMNRSNGNSGM